MRDISFLLPDAFIGPRSHGHRHRRSTMDNASVEHGRVPSTLTIEPSQKHRTLGKGKWPDTGLRGRGAHLDGTSDHFQGDSFRPAPRLSMV